MIPARAAGQSAAAAVPQSGDGRWASATSSCGGVAEAADSGPNTSEVFIDAPGRMPSDERVIPRPQDAVQVAEVRNGRGKRQRRNATPVADDGGGLVPIGRGMRTSGRPSLSEMTNAQSHRLLLSIPPSTWAACNGIRGGSVTSAAGLGSANSMTSPLTGVGRVSSAVNVFRTGLSKPADLMASHSATPVIAEHPDRWDLLQHSATVSPGAVPGGQPKQNGGVSAYHKTARLLQCAIAMQLILQLARDVSVSINWALSCAKEGREPIGSDNEQSSLCFYVQSSYLVMIPVVVSQVICFAVLAWLHASHCYRIWSLRRTVHNVREMGSSHGGMTPSELRRVSGHWTPVASLDVYKESAAQVVKSELPCLYVFFGIGLFWVLSELRVHNMTSAELSGSSAGDATDLVSQACSALGEPGQSPFRHWVCTTGGQFMELFLLLSTVLVSALLSFVVFLPEKFWSPLVSTAVDRTDTYHLGRVLRLNPAISCVLVAVLVVLGPCLALELSPELLLRIGSVYLELFFFTVLAVILSSTGIICWCLDLRSFTSRLPCWKHPPQPASYTQSLWEFCCNPFGLLVRRHSRRYQQLILLSGCLVAFACNDRLQKIHYELWVLRILLLALAALSRDETATFETLRMDGGAGFGLLVDARQLRRALEAHLGQLPYHGDIQTYKATMLRMEDTMSISYRWQQTSADIAYGSPETCRKLNMSRWQMQSVVEGIRKTKCLYVWLDVCSVPQEDTPESKSLKNVLLARMMASYASAFITLVLLSEEMDTHRYHQRTWTLQEYCASQMLMVVKEESSPEGNGDVEQRADVLSVKDTEVQVVGQLRHEHLLRQPMAMPMWLSGSVESVMAATRTEDALQIWHTFKSLSERLNCQFEVDSVRALYPLLWNRPAESEDELISLIKALETVHSIPQQEELSLLLGDNKHTEVLGALDDCLMHPQLPMGAVVPTEPQLPGAVPVSGNSIGASEISCSWPLSRLSE